MPTGVVLKIKVECLMDRQVPGHVQPLSLRKSLLSVKKPLPYIYIYIYIYISIYKYKYVCNCIYIYIYI